MANAPSRRSREFLSAFSGELFFKFKSNKCAITSLSVSDLNLYPSSISSSLI